MRTAVRTAIDSRSTTIARITAGGLYHTIADDRELTIDVDALATRSDGPIVGRLIPF